MGAQKPKAKRKGIGKGPPGNQHAKKLTTPELRDLAYKQYCDHLARGKSKKSWCFEHPNLTLTWNTMEKYLEDTSEFDPLKKEVAQIKGYYKWESIAEDSASGANKDANTASLQMVMRNKFGWDKENSVQKDTSEPLIKKLAHKWRTYKEKE